MCVCVCGMRMSLDVTSLLVFLLWVSQILAAILYPPANAAIKKHV